MKISTRLKEIRLANQFTLKQVGELTGLSISYLSDLERGKAEPPLSTLAVLATAFRMTVIDVLSGVDFAGQLTTSSLPYGLLDLCKHAEYGEEITPEWVAMLSNICIQGKRPQSCADWLEIYLHVRRVLGMT